MGDLRRKVLQTFKKLHRTRMNTFNGDERALKVIRHKINTEYKKFKHVTNKVAIEELNKFAEEVEYEIRTTVVQAIQTEPGKFRDTALVDNVPYKDEKTDHVTDNKHSDKSSNCLCSNTSTSKDKYPSNKNEIKSQQY
ncbi:complex III assembly factor LYRM7 isoform X3 [Megachile rotundata]|uniref:complex III assembly factor LYRM7 isoform X3 n=1 Tax=Megachile rotundata TaxID=143995 RepID=UPI003FD4E577